MVTTEKALNLFCLDVNLCSMLTLSGMLGMISRTSSRGWGMGTFLGAYFLEKKKVHFICLHPLTISNKYYISFEIQATRLGATVAPNKGLEEALPRSVSKYLVKSFVENHFVSKPIFSLALEKKC